MSKLLDISASPRGERSASIGVVEPTLAKGDAVAMETKQAVEFAVYF